MVELLGQAARLCAGYEDEGDKMVKAATTQAAHLAASSSQTLAIQANRPAAEPNTGSLVKVSNVLNNLTEMEIEVAPDRIIDFWPRYKQAFGPDAKPDRDEAPSNEQICALQSLIEAGQNPYAYFAVFGPTSTAS